MRITSKGQVTIPLNVRKKLGLLPNTEVGFELEKTSVRIRKVSRNKQTRGDEAIMHMRGKGSVRMTTGEIMALTRGAQD